MAHGHISSFIYVFPKRINEYMYFSIFLCKMHTKLYIITIISNFMTSLYILQAIELTFHRKTLLISEHVYHILQRISFQIMNSISTAKVTIVTLILEAKVISLCHQYRARPACTSVQSDQALYCWLTNCKFPS